ncbi:MAG: hypothetical protein PHV74_00180 [Dehalococcoidia bacterium]|nr:hypothetical protein [Dehalococcoidia bacterium]
MNWKSALPTVTAIAAIVIMECVAMCNGIDGKVLTLSVAAVAGLGGFKLNDVLKNKKITITTSEEEGPKNG